MIIHVLRTFLMYAVAIFAIRLMGKRQLGELQPAEFVVTLMISELAAIPMQEMGMPALNGIVPIAVLVCIEIFLSVLTLKFGPVRNLLTGKAVPIVEDGQINQKNLKQLRQSAEDLLEELRIKNAFDLNQVIYAQVETNGRISVLIMPENPQNPKPQGYATLIVSDGKVNQENLQKSGRTMAWVEGVLKQHEIESVSDVFLLTVDKYENVVLQRRQLP